MSSLRRERAGSEGVNNRPESAVVRTLLESSISAMRTHDSEGAPPRLDHQALALAQAATLSTPRRRYAVAARLLFAGLDLFYGKSRTLEKFRVLELIARVPYQAWEQAAYVATTHVHEHGALARRVHDRVIEARAQQDNELWHLFVLDELIAEKGNALGRVRTVWLPQIIAFVYYQLSWLLFVVSPA